MIISSFLRRAIEKDRIFNALFELTYDCNLDCVYCCNDKNQRGKPISLTQYDSILREMAEMGIFAITLSGGEPLSHPQFLEIGALCKDHGFLVSIKTNGHAINKKWADRIKKRIDPFSIEISLHGANSATHDRQTRTPGSFEKLLINIPYIRSIGVTVRLNITVTSWNENELHDMADLALNLDCIPMLSPFVSPRDNGDQSPLNMSASQQAVSRTFELLKELRSNQQSNAPDQPLEYSSTTDTPATVDKQCGAGSSFFSLDPFGNILPCAKWREPIGNIHNSTLKQILSSEEIRKVQDINRQARSYAQGRNTDLKNNSFCIAESLLYANRHIGTYPGLEMRDKHLRDIPIILEKQ